jgi:hypothetical protein
LRPFEAFLNPAPALGIGNVHELSADGAAIHASSFLRELAIELKVGMLRGLQESQGIEVGFEITPLAKGFEYSLPFTIGSIHQGCTGGTAGF